MYLEFFESKGHLKMDSFSLVPKNDNSLLLINAGMAPLKPYFTGEEVPPRNRVTTCQKENVGKTARHLTFFEMLGNFSFGDYFKEEALSWSWEFLTDVLKLDKDRIYPTIFEDDDEAFDIWHKKIGLPKDRIKRIGRDENGKSDNFWEHGAGPCGPCSEMYYDRGEKFGCGRPDCGVGCENCDRFMEIWNDVFTQFEGDGKGGYTELKQKNIDTGMGLERLALVMQEVDSVFDIDTMRAIRDKVCELSGKTYETNDKDDVSIRLITDHIRSSTFLVSDGVLPSNEGRGYVLRRLIRRAARHGRLLSIDGAFLAELSKTVISECEDGYPELAKNRDFITRVLSEEEQKFNATIDQGLSILSGLCEKLSNEKNKVLSGEDTFRLYDTFGFPVDLTEEILMEKGFSYDREGFLACMEEQRTRARAARKVSNYMGKDSTVYEKLDKALKSSFTGYDKTDDEGVVSALTNEEEVVDELKEGDKGCIVTDSTPFYGTMGGQCGDTGVIEGPDGRFNVYDTIHLSGGKIGHIGEVEEGRIKKDDRVKLLVDSGRRKLIAKNHSATHLLQAALRKVLGDHVTQAGSDVNDDRLRFDFTHFSAMSSEELKKVEDIVNEKIEEGLSVKTEVMTLSEAKKTGAMALFGEKYGESVRVVSMGDFSTELCGGTHVKDTKDIRAFSIISESGVANGVRRIEAITGSLVFDHFREMEKESRKAADLLKTSPEGLSERIEKLLKEEKELKLKIAKLEADAAKAASDSAETEEEEYNGIKAIFQKTNGLDMNALRGIGDDLKAKALSNDKAAAAVFVLFGEAEGKAFLVSMATEGAVKRGFSAGNLIKASAPMIGGGGGGRPEMAQAGGKNPAGYEDAMKKAKEYLASL